MFLTVERASPLWREFVSLCAYMCACLCVCMRMCVGAFECLENVLFVAYRNVPRFCISSAYISNCIQCFCGRLTEQIVQAASVIPSARPI